MKSNKLIITAIFILASFSCFTCSTNYSTEDSSRNWKYFNIYASSEDDIAFVHLQDDLGISPKMERYILTVNITDMKNAYIIIGGESNPSSKKYAWMVLRKSVQQALLNWTGSNKENLQR